MGQAALGIEIVSDNDFIREVAMTLNDKPTFDCTMIERAFISKIGAGCSAPVACNSTIDEDVINIEAMIGYPDGSHVMYKRASALMSKCDELGSQLAQDFILDGAMKILKKAEEIAFKEEMPQRL